MVLSGVQQSGGCGMSDTQIRDMEKELLDLILDDERGHLTIRVDDGLNTSAEWAGRPVSGTGQDDADFYPEFKTDNRTALLKALLNSVRQAKGGEK